MKTRIFILTNLAIIAILGILYSIPALKNDVILSLFYISIAPLTLYALGAVLYIWVWVPVTKAIKKLRR